MRNGTRMSTSGSHLPYVLLAAVLGLVTPLLARADEDSKPTPLPEPALAAQRLTLGAIALVVIAGIGFYYFRRWQTIKGGNTVYGNTRDD